jgi:hypothetical protein
MSTDDLSAFSDEELGAETDRRIEGHITAWKAVKEGLDVEDDHADRGIQAYLQQLPGLITKDVRRWAAFHVSEQRLEEVWRERSRRKDIRLGRTQRA